MKDNKEGINEKYVGRVRRTRLGTLMRLKSRLRIKSLVTVTKTSSLRGAKRRGNLTKRAISLLVALTLILNLVPLSIFIPFIIETAYAAAGSFSQTSDTDFNANTKPNVSVSGTGIAADAVLSTSSPSLSNAGGGTWQYQRANTVNNSGSELTNYQTGLSTDMPSYPVNYDTNDSSLKGLWHMSEGGSSATTADSSGNSNTGTLTIGGSGTQTTATQAWTNGASGKIGQAINLDGTDDYVDIANGSSFNYGNNNFAIETWVYYNTTPGSVNQEYIVSHTGADDGGYTLTSLSGTSGIQFYAYDGSWKNAAATGLVANTWYHVAAVHDGDLKLYVDGTLKATTSVGTLTNPVANSNLLLGKATNLNNANKYHNGRLDETRIYNRALSAQEIKDHANMVYGLNAGLAGSWHMGEAAGTISGSIADSSGNNYNGTMSGFDTPNTYGIVSGGKYGNGLKFDGSNDKLNAGTSIKSSITNQFTLESWVKTSGGPQPGIMGVLGNDGYLFNGWGIYQDASDAGKPSLSLTGSYSGRLVATSSINDNNWHHVVGTYDGTTARIYIDGNLQNSAAKTLGSISTNAFMIGHTNLSTDGFPGTIDEPRVYTRALSSGEIAERANVTYKLRQDMQDLRYADSTGATEYAYWLESDKKAWVKVPTLANGSNTINMYYGNSSATHGGSYANNGTNTFIYFDDFEDGNIDGWTNCGGTVSVSQSYSIGNYAIKHNGASACAYAGFTYTGTIAVNQNVYVETGSGSDGLQGNTRIGGWGGSEAADFNFSYPNTGYIGYRTPWTNSAVASTTGKWYNIKQEFAASTHNFYIDGKKYGSTARVNTGTINILWNKVNTGGGVYYVDNIYVRQYPSTEPTSQPAGSEASPGYATSGTMTTAAINPTGMYDWGALTFTKATPSGSTLTVDVLRASDNAVLASNVTSGTDINTAGVSNSETSIKLRANLSGDGSNTPSLSDWTLAYSYDTTAPTDPGSLAVGTVTASSVALSWSTSTDAESGLAGYKIERAPDSGGSPGSFAQIDTNASASYTDSTVSANTKYWYKVRSYDNVGLNSGYTSNVSTTTLANVPTSPSASAASTSQIDLSWATGGVQDHYHVYSSTDSYTTPIYNSTATSTNQTGLSANTQYTYRIYGVNADDVNSSTYASASKYTKIQPPTGGSFGTVTKNSIDLSATGSLSNLTTGTSGLYFENTTNPANSGWTQTNSWSNSGLSPNTSYTYQITSRNAESAANTAVAAGSKYTLAADSNVTADKTTSTWYNSTDVIFTNAAGFGAGGVQYYRYVFDQNPTYLSWNDTETQWSAGALTKTASANGSWYLHVKSYNAENAAGTTADYGPYYFDGSAPTDPASLIVGSVTTTSVPLSWTASTDSGGSGLVGYKVERAPDVSGSPGTFAQIGTSATNSWTDYSTNNPTSPPVANTKYWYKVRAYDNATSANNSNYTSNVSATTLANPPINPIATAASISQIDLSWTSGGSQDHYHVYSSSDSYLVPIYNSTTAATSQTTLLANTQHTYRVYGVNSADANSSTYATVSKYTLSATPSVTADKTTSTWYNSTDVIFTNAASFGSSGVQYYRYVFDQNAAHTFNDTETQWTTGTLTRTASANGSWYLHTKSFNGDDVANGTQTYGPYYYDGTVPSDPTGLSATAASTTQINLSWTASTDSGGSNLTGYKVERAPDVSGSPGTFAQIDTSATNSYSDSGLSDNTKYWYRVRSYDNATNDSGYSSNASATTPSAVADPSVPSIASSKNTTSWHNGSSISFSSNRAFDNSGLAYYRYALSQVSSRLVLSSDSLWNSGDLTLPVSTSGIYYLHIKAYNASNTASSQTTYGPYHFDTEDPSVAISSHSSGDYVKGVISLTADASDNVDLSDVSFYDNSLSNRIGDNNTTFDTRSYEGARTIYAKATDTAGNTKVTSIILNIDNVAPSATIPDKPGDDSGSSNNDPIEKVKKGSKVSVYYKIKDNNDYATVEVKVYRRLKRANFNKLLSKTLGLISQKRALTKQKARLQQKKDKISKKKLKSVKKKIKSLQKKFNKYNPYKLKKIKTYDLGEVKTNKTVVFKYSAKNRGVFRLAFGINDQASNSTTNLLEKWLKVM